MSLHDQSFALQGQKEDGETLLMLMQGKKLNKKAEAEEDITVLEQLLHQLVQSQTTSQSTDSI